MILDKEKVLSLLKEEFSITDKNLVKKGKTYLNNYLTLLRSNIAYSTLKSGVKVHNIYHISDIHIRVLDRHDEYESCFENLFESLRSKPPGVIIVTGDIFHTKDKILSETILIFDKFISGLCEIMDTILIPGNHDVYAHSDRLDTIIGLTTIKKYKNFWYLDKSGVYQYGDLDIIACLDRFIRHEELSNIGFASKEDQTSVCLYHGPVQGSLLDNNTKVFDQSYHHQSHFDGYDLVLLGDIHKHQFLAKNSAYAGSLIQQSYKEELTEHGYIDWNVSTRSGSFVPIENSFGFVKVFVGIDSFTEPDIFPKNTRVKFMIEEDLADSSNISERLAEVKEILDKKTNVISIAKDIVSSKTAKQCKSDNEVDEKTLEIKDEELIKILLEGKDSKVVDEIISMHAQKLSENEIQEDKIIGSWTIQNLTFKNVFIYGEDFENSIDFTDKKGSIGILGNNAVGKTCILNIILFALFGQIFKTRSYNVRNIINKNKKAFSISLTVKMNDVEYTIYRTGRQKKRKDMFGMEDSVSIKKVDSEKTEYITDSDKIKTNDMIKKVLGISDRDEFILTNVLSNVTNKSLIGMTSGNMEEVFRKLFNLDLYKDIYSDVQKEVRGLSKELNVKEGEQKILERKDNNATEKLLEIQNTIELIDQENKDIQQNLTKIQKAKLILENKINDMEDDIKIPIKTLSLMNNELYTLTKELNEYTPLESPVPKNINDLIKEKKNQLNFLSDVSAKQTNLSIESVEIKIKDFEKKIKQIPDQDKTEYKKAKNLLKSSQDWDLVIKSIKHKMIEVVENENHTIIPSSLWKDISSFITNIQENADLSSFLTAHRIVADAEYWKMVALENQKNIDLVNSLRRCKKWILVEDLLDFEEIKRIDFLQNALKEKEEEIELFKKNEINVKQLENLHSEIFDTDKMFRQFSEMKKESDKNLKDLYTKLGVFKKAEEDSIEKNKSLKEVNECIVQLSQRIKILNVYKDIVNDKGIPKLFLRESLSVIEKETNKILYSLAGLKMHFENSEEKYEILIKKENIFLGPEQCSGYEKFILNVALKMALDKLKYYSGIKMIFIDEVWDCVSSDNMDKIDDLLVYLKDYYTHIIVISHNEELKNKVDHRINIESDTFCSKILQ